MGDRSAAALSGDKPRGKLVRWWLVSELFVSLSMAVSTQEVALIELRLDVFEGFAGTADSEVFFVWIAVMELQSIDALTVSALRALPSQIDYCLPLSFTTTFYRVPTETLVAPGIPSVGTPFASASIAKSGLRLREPTL
jgi:hypothetical protein